MTNSYCTWRQVEDLRYRRKALGLSIRDICNIADIPKGSMSVWETMNCKYPPQMKQYERWKKAIEHLELVRLQARQRSDAIANLEGDPCPEYSVHNGFVEVTPSYTIENAKDLSDAATGEILTVVNRRDFAIPVRSKRVAKKKTKKQPVPERIELKPADRALLRQSPNITPRVYLTPKEPERKKNVTPAPSIHDRYKDVPRIQPPANYFNRDIW